MSRVATADLETELLSELRERVGEPMTEQVRTSVLMLVDRILTNFPCLSPYKGEQEYMSEVLAMRPNWQRQVEALRGANKACAAALDELSHRIAHELPLAKTDHDVGRRLERWMESLAVLRDQENRLHQRAYTVDLGGES